MNTLNGIDLLLIISIVVLILKALDLRKQVEILLTNLKTSHRELNDLRIRYDKLRQMNTKTPALLAMLKKCVNFYFEGETDFQDDVYALIEEAEGGTWNGYEKLPSQDVRVGMEIRTAFGWVKVLHVSRIVARDKEDPYYLFQHKESAPSIKHEKNDLVSVKKGWVTFLPAMDE